MDQPQSLAHVSRAIVGTINCHSVRFGDRLFVFRQPISLEVDVSDGVWSYECRSFGILAYGQSQMEASNMFASDFAAFWDLIAEGSDHLLSPEAVDLKGRLRALVESVRRAE